MSILASLFFLILSACSHRPIQTAQQQKRDLVSPHPCFTAAAQNDLRYLQENLETCKTVRSQQGTTPLMLASAKGRDEVVNLLLQNGVDPNETDKQGETALVYATVANRVDTVGLLVLSGAHIEAQNSDGITPLMMALQSGSPQMVYTLSVSRQGINARAEDGWTPLYFAIRRKDSQILGWLLRQGACVNTVDTYKQTPIDFAQEAGWPEGLAALKKAPPCKEKKSHP